MSGSAFTRRVLLTAGLLSTTALSPAHAQSATASTTPTTNLPSLTVKGQHNSAQSPTGPGVGYVATRSDSATKTDAPIAETPQTVNVVTQKQLEQQQPKNIPQALRYTPGVTSETAGTDGGGNWVQIRGFSGYDSIFLDGLQTDNGNFTYQLEPYGLERLDVLKGPSSMLYGQNEPGGLVNAISKRPTDTPQHEITIQGGSYGEKQVGVDTSGPVEGSGGKLDYRIVGMDRQSGTQVNDSENNRQYFAPSLTWKPDDATTLTLLASYLRIRMPGWAGPYFPALGTAEPNPNGQISPSTFPGVPGFDEYNLDQEQIGWELDHRFSDALKFVQNVRYNHINGFSQDAYGTALEADDTTLDRATFGSKVLVNTVNLDNHLEYDVLTGPVAHKLLFGIDYRHLSGVYTNMAGTASPIDIYDPSLLPNYVIDNPIYARNVETVNQIGEYAQDQMIWGGWHLTGGVRHDNAGSETTDTVGGTSSSQDNSAWTWRSALLYAFENGIAPYVSYSTSFLPTAGTDYENNPFKPTRARQYEVGLKYKPPGYNALFTAALFDIDEHNALTTDVEHPYYEVQTGEVRSRGLELEAKISPAPGFDLDAAYTYDDAVIVSDTEDQGNAMPNVPLHAVSLWGHYKLQHGVVQGFGMGAGVRYNSGYFGDNTNFYRTAPVTLIDMELDYDLGHIDDKLKGVSLQFNATNLLNTTYLSNCITFGEQSCIYGAGRVVYGTLAYRW